MKPSFNTVLCSHKDCRGRAVPAVKRLLCQQFNNPAVCQQHAYWYYNRGFNDPNRWVQLTPNQRPVSVKE